jgi:PKD repeat protein
MTIPYGMQFSMDDKYLITGNYQTVYTYYDDTIRTALYFREPTQGVITDSIVLTNTNYSGKFITTPDSFGILIAGRDGYLRLYNKIPAPIPLRAFFKADPTIQRTGKEVHFIDQSIGNPQSWLWDFGDGNTSTDQNPIHSYTNSGHYTVKLIVYSGIKSDTLIKTDYIIVVLPLLADFSATPLSGSVPLQIQFTDNSLGSPINWKWDFGDGKTSIEQNPIHTYTKKGYFSVKLIITDSYFTDTLYIKDLIYAQQSFKLDFTADPKIGDVPLQINFTNLTNRDLNNWYWDFGDGTTGTEKNPTHTYITAGYFSVKLIGNDGYITDSITYQNLIFTKQSYKLDFTADPMTGTIPLLVNFTNLTNKDLINWYWNFGDGGTSTEKNPSHTYNYEGTFNVILIGSDGYIIDTLKKDTLINTKPKKINEVEVLFERNLQPFNSQTFGYNGISGQNNDYYVLGGKTNIRQSIIFRLDENGDTSWVKNYPAGIKLIQLTDGKLVIMDADSVQQKNIFYYCIDEQGESLWKNEFIIGTKVTPHGIHAVNDNTFLIDGTNIVLENYSKILVKFYSNGNVIWNTKDYSFYPYFLTPTYDGGYTTFDYVNQGDYKFNHYNHDNFQSQLNDITFIHPFTIKEIIQTSDDGYLITGTIINSNEKISNIIKTDSTGKVLWSHSAEDTTILYKDIDKINDWLYVINTEFGVNPGFILIELNGNIKQQVALRERNASFASVSATKDSCLFFTGTYISFIGDSSIYCLKTRIDPQYLNIPQEPVNSDSLNLKVSPNPFTSTFSIEYYLNGSNNVKITLYDVFGNQIAVLDDNYRLRGTQRLEYNGSGLFQGMYFLHLQAGKDFVTEKVVYVK